MKDLDIKKCLDGRVEAGLLSRDAAEKALRTIRDLEQRYAAEMAPDTALSAAVAETARIMKEAAEREKARTARQILTVARVMDDVQAHPDGAVAGAMAVLVRDMRGKATFSNVEARQEVVLGQIMRRMADGLNSYRSKAAGLTQNTAGMRNVIREMHGTATNDAEAASFAKSWREASEFAADRYIGAGGDLVKRDDWRHPQVTDARRVRQLGREAWTEHLIQAAERGDLQVIDFDTGAPATGLKLATIIKTAGDNILSEMPPPPGKGGSYGRHNERRVFQWQNADAFLAYNDQFGVGNDLFGLLVGHMQGMARDIALTEVLGPKHGATVRAIQEAAYKAEGARDMGVLARLNPVRSVESAAAIGRTYDVLSGRLGAAQSELTAAIFGGVRNWMTASKLGSALVSAVPADSVMATWAAKANGVPAVKLLGSVLAQLNPASEADRVFALRMGIVSSAVMDSAIGSKRFADEIVGQGITGRMASFVVRAQGLAAWTNGVKNAFMLEMMGHVADNAGKPLGEVDAPLRKMLERYGFSAADWDVIRAAPQMEHEGARFFDPANVSDRQLGERLMEAIVEERAFAVLEPDARVRQLTTGGLQRGSFWGEMARSAMLFKSFSITMATTHLARAFIDANGSKVAQLAALSAMLTLAGAVSIQARQIITGKDPRQMDDPKFWGAAWMQGGGAGIFGDFFAAGLDRGQQGLPMTLAGPVFGLADQAARLAIPDYRKVLEGEPTKFGAEVARFVRYNLPGANLWYSRLVTDRAVMDTIQSLADPEYRQSFRRMEERARKDYGQRFWWRPGHSAPDRAPDLGAALPR